MEYSTLSAREASFAPPTKRSKAGWPHSNPSSTELAKAGFYYKPFVHSNDNVACFTCDRNLDGWEEDDDALQEHLKHGDDCAWALLMALDREDKFNPADMEDPTGPHLSKARKTTFAMGWPHENKRAWVCKSEKMVEAGWHFAPSPEYEDFVSCVYCKLSLDGWEPKDDPFDEHHKRSPACPFFVFTGNTAPWKRAKAKKGRASRAARTSKASTRLSTQSNMTAMSFPESSHLENTISLDESIDNSVVSVMSTASTATTKGKRKAASRPKVAKTKKAKTTRVKAKTIEPDALEKSQLCPILNPDSGETPKITSYETKALEVAKEATPKAISPEATGLDETGPVEHEASPIPVLVPSPLKDKTAYNLPKAFPVRSSPTAVARLPEVEASTRSVRSPSQPSDVENAPPSSRPESQRPPLSSPGTIPPSWTPVEVELAFQNTPLAAIFRPSTDTLSDPEKQMTVQEWIEHIAGQAEEDLRAEGERIVGLFEKEGQRALNVLESIECT